MVLHLPELKQVERCLSSKIKHCYCQIPPPFLEHVVWQKFVQKIPTDELWKECRTEKEREFVNTIVLLDVSEAELAPLLKKEKNFYCNFLHCRERAREVLEQHFPDRLPLTKKRETYERIDLTQP